MAHWDAYVHNQGPDGIQHLNWIRENEPVLRMPNGPWLITRHEDIEWVFRSDGGAPVCKNPLVSGHEPPYLRTDGYFRKHFIHNIDHQDGADHVRVRKLLHRTFTPHAIEGMREATRRVAEELLDTAIAAHDGEMDLVSDYALLVPTTVIMNLLDIPEEEFTRMQTMVQHTGGVFTPGIDLDAWITRADAIFEERHHYFKALVADRLESPGPDLISELAARRQADPDVLSEIELTMNLTFLVAAGFDTTVNGIGSALHLLLQHNEQLSAIREDRRLWPQAIEECLRFQPPLPFTAPRVAAEAFEIRGQAIEPGDQIWAGVIAGNRDPRVFDDPDTFNIFRETGIRKKHLTFAMYSAHYCLGAALARMEMHESLEAISDRFPDMRFSSTPPYQQFLVVFGPSRLQLEWGCSDRDRLR
ncbi:MAG: cytochrome P450 [bacterium]|nr:cytochrome P450 [bacterium]